MLRNESNIVFSIFNEWIIKRGYHRSSEFTKKELWKKFDNEIKTLGENIWYCSDLNSLKKKMDLSYMREDGWFIDGPFMTKEIKLKGE